MFNYLIFPTYEEDFLKAVIIIAKNKKDAIRKFSDMKIKIDKDFIEYLHDKSCNMSFAEQFWMKERKEIDHFCQTGEILINEQEFSKRIYDFFENNQSWAELYLKYYFSENNFIVNFPDEMLSFIWFKNFDELDYAVLNLDNIMRMS